LRSELRRILHGFAEKLEISGMDEPAGRRPLDV
jgi:hypothetical protein